jgi:hypothetical protein
MIAADGSASDQFGSDVSLYSSMAMIGANYDDNKANDAGDML